MRGLYTPKRSPHFTPRAALSSLRIKLRCDWPDDSTRLHSTADGLSDVTTLHTSSPSPWRSPALPPGRLPPLGCSGWDASLPPPLWSSYQRVRGQDGCRKPGKALGGKSSISLTFYSAADVQLTRLFLFSVSSNKDFITLKKNYLWSILFNSI